MAMKTAGAFDPRPMMERTVEVMRESVLERRADGSPSPKMGAVLVRPDGSMVTAARGIGPWIGPRWSVRFDADQSSLDTVRRIQR